MEQLLVNLLLILVAMVLLIILSPVGIAYGVVVSFRRRNIAYLSGIFRTIAVSLDQLGNVVCGSLFNDILITKDWYKFGDEDLTISYVLSRNKKTNTLKTLGMWLYTIIDRIDPGHFEDISD